MGAVTVKKSEYECRSETYSQRQVGGWRIQEDI